MMSDQQISVELLLGDAQALALAQLVKRIGWSEMRSLAVSENEAYLMRDAVSEVAKALAAEGYAPR